MAFPWTVFLTLFVIVILASSQCQGCNLILRQPSGTFTSPGYPQNYTDGTLCSWTIQTDLKHIITLSFSDLQLEPKTDCGYDSVNVYDGDESSDPLLGRYCGAIVPSMIRSTGNMLYVVFRADRSNTGKGFSAFYQSQECNKAWYGPMCTQECSQGCVNNDCHTATGTCTYGCKDGYTGVKCDECSEGRYGPICTQACSEGCSDNNCDRVTGNCLGGCKDGYTGDSCNECVNGKYGSTCTLSCAINCDSGQCQRDTGYCTRCLDGYYGNVCENTCLSGQYGPDCTQPCPENCKTPVCDHVNGTCSDGCKDGFSGAECASTCLSGQYGPDCIQPCPENCKTPFCNHVNGSCSDGCKDGFSGAECASNIISEDSSDSLGKGIGIGVGAMAIFGIIIAVVGVCCYQRCSSPAARRQEPQVYDETKMDSKEEHSYKKMCTSDDTHNPPTDAPSENIYQNATVGTTRQSTQSANDDANFYEEVTEMRSVEGTRGDHPGSTDVIRNTTMSTEESGDEIYVNAGMTE